MTSDTTQVAARLPPDLLARLDAYVAKLMKEHPGMKYTRTDGIRIALAAFLPPLASDATPMPSPAKRAKRRP
ncbi:MAG: ribbon-helix-helix domain-containing protein [Polyangiaceae bacterium]|nr:ribbon-helix-helix domain-containing protein [Polyangiaceae bacterium]